MPHGNLPLRRLGVLALGYHHGSLQRRSSKTASWSLRVLGCTLEVLTLGLGVPFKEPFGACRAIFRAITGSVGGTLLRVTARQPLTERPVRGPAPVRDVADRHQHMNPKLHTPYLEAQGT